jgi:hypothetical protein
MRMRKLGSALVLSTIMAAGMSSVFTARLSAFDNKTISNDVICKNLLAAETAVNSLPDGLLKQYLQKLIGDLEDRYNCR